MQGDMKGKRLALVACITACIALSSLIVLNVMTDGPIGIMQKHFIAHLLLLISPCFLGLAFLGVELTKSNPRLASVGIAVMGFAAAATALAVRTLLK